MNLADADDDDAIRSVGTNEINRGIAGKSPPRANRPPLIISKTAPLIEKCQCQKVLPLKTG